MRCQNKRICLFDLCSWSIRIPARALLIVCYIFIIQGIRLADGGEILAAEEVDEQLPYQNLVTPDEIKRDFHRWEFKPLDDPSLSMHFLAPKDWQSQPITVKKADLLRDHLQLITLVLMTSLGDRARIEVTYSRVKEEIELEIWAKAYIESNHLKLIKYQEGTFSGRKVFDTLVEAPDNFFVRMSFSRHGQRIIIIGGSTLKKDYPEFVRILAIAVVSFKMTAKTGSTPE